jgi:hypothetical protein
MELFDFSALNWPLMAWECDSSKWKNACLTLQGHEFKSQYHLRRKEGRKEARMERWKEKGRKEGGREGG